MSVKPVLCLELVILNELKYNFMRTSNKVKMPYIIFFLGHLSGICFTHKCDFLTNASLLGDLPTVLKTKKNMMQTNQMLALLLNDWPRTIAKTITTAKNVTKFSLLIILFSFQL